MFEADSKQSCTQANDCTDENETCHFFDDIGEAYCGPLNCQINSDCPDVGQMFPHGSMFGSCNNGLCVYQCCLFG